ncbi:UNVERIFIED_CONTAM: hypothetical protein FKN15_020544 [Acipenser sinensis]
MVAASVGVPRDPKMDFKELLAMIMKNTAAQEEQTRRMERQTQELLRQRGEEPPLPEPRGEEPPLPEPRGEEGRSIPPLQPRPPPLQSSSALLRPVPQPLLLDTLPVFLDLPVLDLEPRSLQHWPQLCRCRSPEGRRGEAYLHCSPDHHPYSPVRRCCVQSLNLCSWTPYRSS